MGPVTVRDVRPEDAEALAALVARARDAGELAASSDQQGTWLVPYALGGPGRAAVAEPDDEPGALVGFAVPETKVVVVDPAWRRQGIGRVLAEALVDLERRRARTVALLGVAAHDAAGQAFAEAVGFAYHSSVWYLALPRQAAVAEPVWPAGHRAVPFDHRVDTPRWAELYNAAFADHPTPVVLDADQVAAEWASWGSSDEDVLLVEDAGGRLAAFCAVERHVDPVAGPAEDGEIWSVGVRPDLQGRGLGRQALRWGVARLRGLGAATVVLAVNARNASALGLYEAEGFQRREHHERWWRAVPAAAADAAHDAVGSG